MEIKEKKMLTARKAEDFSEWYQQAIINSEFVDYSAVSGMIAFRPAAYFAWDAVRSATSKLFIESGIQDVYFPMLIPEHLLEKEQEHVEGFSPEVAWVTHTGKSKIDERLAIRPTSETIMYYSYSKWIRSWRDLPMRFNQWNSVIRWEFKHPVPLLRSREFMWNEGHTAFATKEDAEAERDVVLGIYEKVLKDYLALPGIKGRKTDKEKFAGALASFSIEHMLPNGLAIQGPDFHVDGQNFAKVFDIKFLDKDGSVKYAYQNTFAISTRELGVMIAVHGDDKGIVLPPKLALVQVVIIPIFKEQNRAKIIAAAHELSKALGGIRVFVDETDAYSPGWKFNEWELKGVPVRIEIGEKEVSGDSITVARRDTLEKMSIKKQEAREKLLALLEDIHVNLYKRALERLSKSIHKVSTMKEFKELIESRSGFAQAPWCGKVECEDKIKEETGAKATNMPFDVQGEAEGKKCVYCGSDAIAIVNFAKSY